MLKPLVTSQDARARRTRPLLRATLGHVLRRTRLGQGRTLADVARTAKVSMQYLSELERGRKEASSEILAAICDALEIDLPDLLAEVGRDLAGAPQERTTGQRATGQQATVLRLGTGPDRLGTGPDQRTSRPDDAVCLLAA
jgi:transcriptional regulator with XRE-family HTH domain